MQELLVKNDDLTWWQNVLTYIVDFSVVSTWALGSWVKPDWDEPLPDRLVLDQNFFRKYHGLPFIYKWRVSALDLTSFGAGAALKGASLLVRGSAIVKDFAVFSGLGYFATEKLLTPRAKDEVVVVGAPSSPLFWLSAEYLVRQGYTQYDITKEGYYVLIRS